MRVISVDPAPGKDSVVFDDNLHPYRCAAGEIISCCDKWSQEDSVLLCWDAPLTGPPTPDNKTSTQSKSAYTQRTIEKFFAQEITKHKAPPGISVRPYSGCPHWAITRAAIGLPRVSRFDSTVLPFQLIHDSSTFKNSPRGKWVVETHPALAIWLWCREERQRCEGPDASWIYKGASKSSGVIKKL